MMLGLLIGLSVEFPEMDRFIACFFEYEMPRTAIARVLASSTALPASALPGFARAGLRASKPHPLTNNKIHERSYSLVPGGKKMIPPGGQHIYRT